MSFRFPAPGIARYVGHKSQDLAEFRMPSPVGDCELMLILGRLPGWEYAQVVGSGRCPTWEEMKAAKDACWGAEDVCLQLHPAQSRYVNKSEFSLWIWRPTNQVIAQPPLWAERDGSD